MSEGVTPPSGRPSPSAPWHWTQANVVAASGGPSPIRAVIGARMGSRREGRSSRRDRSAAGRRPGCSDRQDHRAAPENWTRSQPANARVRIAADQPRSRPDRPRSISMSAGHHPALSSITDLNLVDDLLGIGERRRLSSRGRSADCRRARWCRALSRTSTYWPSFLSSVRRRLPSRRPGNTSPCARRTGGRTPPGLSAVSCGESTVIEISRTSRSSRSPSRS